MAINPDLIPTNWEKRSGNIIKVIGVGGGGSNAVSYMHSTGVSNVDFVICNTDIQALESSDVDDKLQIGDILTKGLGAGTDAMQGRKAAEESIEKIDELFKGSVEMVFITCGMGGGTGTGAAPVVAAQAKKAGKLTVGVVTLPFRDEGDDALDRAIEGIKEMSHQVDSLLIIDNKKLYELYGDLDVFTAFHKADEVLCTAVQSIADVITKCGQINADFADVSKVMRNGGMALMGMGVGEGENRVGEAVEKALKSPLLNEMDLTTAKRAIVNITTSTEPEKTLTMSELSQIMDSISSATGNNISFKRGIVRDPNIGDKISVTIIVTGLEMSQLPSITRNKKNIIEVKMGKGCSIYEKSGVPLQPEEDLHINSKLVVDGIPSLITDSLEQQAELLEEPAYWRREKMIKSKMAENQQQL